MSRRFQIHAWEVEEWLEKERLLYASTSEGADGEPLKLYYLVGLSVWAIERGQRHQYVLITPVLQSAVAVFNGLV